MKGFKSNEKKSFKIWKKNRELFEDRTKKTNYEDIIILIVKKKIEKKILKNKRIYFRETWEIGNEAYWNQYYGE